MKTIAVLVLIFAYSFAAQDAGIFCSSQSVDGYDYFCDPVDKSGFYGCLPDGLATQDYFMACPLGTTCQCPSGSACPDDFGSPCRTAPANDPGTTFCSAVAGGATSMGYYCSPDHTGFYQCLPDAWASLDSFQACPAGTTCGCNYGIECSNGGTQSPCVFPSTSPTDLCGAHHWNCNTGSDLFDCSAGSSCPVEADGIGTWCFEERETGNGRCTHDNYCSSAARCSVNADCPSGFICTTNTCCGDGVCFKACDE